MALIRLGAMLTDISGKIGGQTFGTSASGSYVKNSGTPRKSITLAQRSKMALMGTTAQRWRALSDAQRAVFNAASPDYPYLNRVGETKYYSGYAIYCQLINNLSLSVFSLVPIPLPKFAFTPLATASLSGGPGSLNFVGTGGQSGKTYRLFISRASSPGISNPYKNQFFINSSNASIAGLLGIPVQIQYTAKWGVPPASGKIYWRIDVVDGSTGQIYKGLNSGVYNY